MQNIIALDQETLSEIHRYSQLGLSLLELNEDTKPIDVVTRIDRVIHQVRSGALGELDAPTKQEQTLALGVLLGEQYVQALGWHWAEVQPEGEQATYTRVLNMDNSIAINPITFIDERLHDDSPVMILTHFYSATMGRLPKADPGQALAFF